MNNYENYIQRCKAKHGDKFSAEDLNPAFVAAYNSKKRITVAFVSTTGEIYDVQRGTVGATTGWKPCFLLMRRSTDHGSSYTIGRFDKIVPAEEYTKFKKANKQ